jgi:virginiamycin B lyase
MWFTEFAADKIGRISPAGVITQFSVPTADAGPYQITAGPHGAMWFTEYDTTADGQVTEFPVPRPSYGPAGITGSGPGPVYGTDPAGFIDTISEDGWISPARVPSAADLPFAIARLPGGTLWISEPGLFRILAAPAQLPDPVRHAVAHGVA